MSVTYIPNKVKFELWGKSAGRCQYEGCNHILWRDFLTQARFNTAYIAHIIADKEGGPRGDHLLSESLKKDISNLMLLCDTHHRLIDIEDVIGHPVERLQEMKKRHENRINIQTSLGDDKQSQILHYGANIGRLNARITWNKSYEAMAPNRYPEESAIELSLKNSPFQDDSSEFWEIERKNLQRQFFSKVQSRLNTDINHLSVFALAPQPLLIELGRLISDVSAVDVFQHQREPQDNWVWQNSAEEIKYKVIFPDKSSCSKVALNISLSADIDNLRILSVLGEDVCIWTLTIPNPNNDFLKTREQLSEFRITFRKLLNDIKSYHGQNSVLNIFPAAPVSIAIELGRVWMPKADLPLRIYEQNSSRDGFFYTFRIDSFEKLS